MIRHAARGVPWLLIAVTGTLLTGLLQVVASWPYELWPLQGCAVGLLAGTAAWCFDEPAAAVVDSAPRSLAWRTAARSAGVLALLSAWMLAVSGARHGLFGHAAEVAWQGVAAALLASAYVTWRRSTGTPSPGRRTAAAVVPLAAFWALVRPLSDAVPLLPYTEHDDWAVSAAIWTAAAAVAAGVLSAALGDLP